MDFKKLKLVGYFMLWVGYFIIALFIVSFSLVDGFPNPFLLFTFLLLFPIIGLLINVKKNKRKKISLKKDPIFWVWSILLLVCILFILFVFISLIFLNS